MTQPPEYPQNEGWNLRLQKIRARFDLCLLYQNLCAELIVSYDFANVNRDFRLQIGIFIYKTGKLITKRDFYLQNGIFVLQTGLSFCNLLIFTSYINIRVYNVMIMHIQYIDKLLVT